MSGMFAAALCAMSANACYLQVRIACPNDRAAAGVKLWVDNVGYAVTDSLGIATFLLPTFDTYTVCVDTTTLPPGATLSPKCQKIKVTTDAPPVVEFVLGGDFCSTPPPPGPCWMTGGGTIGKDKGTPNYSYGGVVYPGCSPNAADGGNWNVIDHATGLHFQGKTIIVDSCSGIETRSPRVSVNIIDFHGTGIIGGIGGNPDATVPVSFVGRAIDNHDGGAGSDMMFLSVTDGVSIMMQIGTDVNNPAIISTGNIQIHQSSCDK